MLFVVDSPEIRPRSSRAEPGATPRLGGQRGGRRAEPRTAAAARTTPTATTGRHTRPRRRRSAAGSHDLIRTCCANPRLRRPGRGGPPKKATVRRNVTTNYLVAVAIVVVGFLTTPILTHQLGILRYGVWALIGSLIPFLEILELGFASATVAFVSRHLELEDNDKVGRRSTPLSCVFRCSGYRFRRRRGLCDLSSRSHHEHSQEPGGAGAVPPPAPRVRHGALHPDGHVRRERLLPCSASTS